MALETGHWSVVRGEGINQIANPGLMAVLMMTIVSQGLELAPGRGDHTRLILEWSIFGLDHCRPLGFLQETQDVDCGDTRCGLWRHKMWTVETQDVDWGDTRCGLGRHKMWTGETQDVDCGDTRCGLWRHKMWTVETQDFSGTQRQRQNQTLFLAVVFEDSQIYLPLLSGEGPTSRCDKQYEK
ncbi:hypothetical protein RRG08_037188 [Elysia crispata]|uniref:Uncharacterized protein n=1 Tax=Elysia crispata TaxID=231223 RepID=A0AAE1D9B2_9GAST|nr:hypothetical protein RRG08_037188 [Elysia crispata]